MFQDNTTSTQNELLRAHTFHVDVWHDEDIPLTWTQKISILLNGAHDERHDINRTRETGKYNEREFRCRLGYRIVSSTPFTLLVAIVIVSSSIILGIEANFRIHIYGIEIFFFNFFIIEIIIRILSFKCRYFWSLIWNVLDLGLVIVSIIPDSVYQSESSRQFRTARLFRLIKLGRIFPRLRALLVGLQNSLTPLFWISFMLLIVFYAFAVFVTTVVGHDYHLWKDSDFESAGIINEEHPTEEDIRNWFGTIGKSMFTLFQITTGESWGLIVRSVHAQKPLMTPVFILWIGLTNFAFMNIITGIVVDSTIKAVDRSNKRQYEDTQVRPLLMHHLRRIDVDGGGELTQEQIEQALNDKEFREGFQELGVNPDYIPQLFRAFDQDQGGTVDFTDFCRGFLTLDNPIQRKEIALLRGLIVHVRRNLKESNRQLLTEIHDSKVITSITSRTPTNNHRTLHNKGHNIELQSDGSVNNSFSKVNTDVAPAIKKEITHSNNPVPKLKMNNQTNHLAFSPPIIDKVKVVTESMPTGWRPKRFDIDLSNKLKGTRGTCPLSLVVEKIRTGVVDTPPVFYMKTSQVGAYSKITVTKLKQDKVIIPVQNASFWRQLSAKNMKVNRNNQSETFSYAKNQGDIKIISEIKLKENIDQWLNKADKQLKQLEQQAEMLTETLPAALDLIFSRQNVFENLLKNQLYELDSLAGFLQGGHVSDGSKIANISLGIPKNQYNLRLDDAPPTYSEHINNTEPTGFTPSFLGTASSSEQLFSQRSRIKEKSEELSSIKSKKTINSSNKQYSSSPMNEIQRKILKSESKLKHGRSYQVDHDLSLLVSETHHSSQRVIPSLNRSPSLELNEGVERSMVYSHVSQRSRSDKTEDNERKNTGEKKNEDNILKKKKKN